MKKKRGVSGKAFALLLAVVLALGCAIGGTVAWLIDDTESVVNTFTYGDINIALKENTGNEYKILPGNDIEKDPYVIVKANSESCWLFVEVEEAGDFVNGKVTWALADGWIALDGHSGVYYREVDATTADTDPMYVLKDNKVIVSEELTKQEVNSITTQPTLTFTAYAVQRDSNITTAADAWAKVEANQPTVTP